MAEVRRARSVIVFTAAAVWVLASMSKPAVAADPACGSLLSGLRNAQQQIAPLLATYNKGTPEQKNQNDADFRASLSRYTSSTSLGMSTMSGAAQINENVRAATGGSIINLLASARRVTDAPRILQAFASAVSAYCNGPELSGDDATHAIQRFAYDKDAYALGVAQSEAQASLEEAKRRSDAFEVAAKRADLGTLTAALKEQQKDVDRELGKSALEGAGTAALSAIKAMGPAGNVLSEALGHTKDWTTGTVGLAQFAAAATSNKPLTRSDWENLGKGVLDITGGTASAITLAGAEFGGAVAATSAVIATAEVAATAVTIAGISSWALEQGLLLYEGAQIDDALRQTTDSVAANRELLAYQLRTSQQRLESLARERDRLARVKKRLGIP